MLYFLIFCVFSTYRVTSVQLRGINYIFFLFRLNPQNGELSHFSHAHLLSWLSCFDLMFQVPVNRYISSELHSAN